MTTPFPNFHFGVASRSEKFEFNAGDFTQSKYVDAGSGDDYIRAYGYYGVLIGGLGNDTIFGNGTIYGDLNQVDGPTVVDPILGPSDNDQLFGGETSDAIYGAGGSDLLVGLGGNDILSGGTGSDQVHGGYGNDSISGGDGNDTLYAGAPDGFGLFSSFLNYDGVTDQALPGGGQSVIYPAVASQNGGNFNDTVDGGSGDDRIYLDDGADIAFGGSGNDTIFGGSGANTIDGGPGDDLIEGGGGADLMYGGAGSDTYLVDNQLGTIIELAGGGNDSVITTANYKLPAGVENLFASFGVLKALSLTGNESRNSISGGGGNDVLLGLGGNDAVNGGAGADRIYGGLGNDVMTGGSGKDIFVFNTKPNKTLNVDTITDFSPRDDTIHLENAYFKVGSAGQLRSSSFVTGTKAKDADDRIIYDQTTGALYYDADGTGRTTTVKIAQLDKGLHLTYKDFFII